MQIRSAHTQVPSVLPSLKYSLSVYFTYMTLLVHSTGGAPQTGLLSKDFQGKGLEACVVDNHPHPILWICIIREVWEILVYTTSAGGGSNLVAILELGLWETVAQTRDQDCVWNPLLSWHGEGGVSCCGYWGP